MLERSVLPLAALVLFAANVLGADALPLADAGKQLADTLDSLDVESHWKAGEHVTNWQTGEADGRQGGPKTHCSLLVATCARPGVPMLSPAQTFLSDRQQDWLRAEGKDQGWRQVSAVGAQRLANRGGAGPRQLPESLPGEGRPHGRGPPRRRHRAGGPGARAARRPAGSENSGDTDARTGFRHHRRARPRHGKGRSCLPR
jgi:hypothetical protein